MVIVGAGGNIGSHLVGHVARMREVTRLVLIDRDRYEERNLAGQEITRAAVGRRKAHVQARRARAIRADLDVVTIPEDVEHLPLACLRADVILACLDTRRARQFVNQAARHLGVPWVDAGVLADGALARIDVFLPGGDQPCLECGWSEADYAALEQTYPCAPDPAAAFPTEAPSSLGALAAALQALECAKLLAGGDDSLPLGGQVVLDAAHHRHFVTRRRRNPDCRLADHAVWHIEPLGGTARETTLDDLFGLAERRLGLDVRHAIRVDSAWFARTVVCPGCDHRKPLLRLATRLRPVDLSCPRCGATMSVMGFGLTDRLERDALDRRQLERGLHALGLRAGDVITVGAGDRELHFEIAGVPARPVHPPGSSRGDGRSSCVARLPERPAPVGSHA